jgi:hypothetical protein
MERQSSLLKKVFDPETGERKMVCKIKFVLRLLGATDCSLALERIRRSQYDNITQVDTTAN